MARPTGDSARDRLELFTWISAYLFQHGGRVTVTEAAETYGTTPQKVLTAITTVGCAGASGEASKGQRVFNTQCKSCHTLEKDGAQVTAPVQIIGAWNPRNETFTWAWDHPSVRVRLRAFAAEREWERFHSPKNLAMAVSGEAGELVAELQWASGEESLTLEKRAAVAAEMADVLIYLCRLADVLDVDLIVAAERKLEADGRRYAVDEVRGSAAKRR